MRLEIVINQNKKSEYKGWSEVVINSSMAWDQDRKLVVSDPLVDF